MTRLACFFAGCRSALRFVSEITNTVSLHWKDLCNFVEEEAERMEGGDSESSTNDGIKFAHVHLSVPEE